MVGKAQRRPRIWRSFWRRALQMVAIVVAMATVQALAWADPPLSSRAMMAVDGQGAGEDLSAYVSREDARLGAGAGTIVLAQPGRLGQSVTLGRGHNLELRAPITWAATVRLAGDNSVHCAAGASVTAQMPEFAFGQQPGALLLAQGVSGVRVEGCHVNSATQSVLLAGYPIFDLTMQGNVLSGLTLAGVNSPDTNTPSQRLSFSGNSVTMPGGKSNNAGVLLFYAKGVTASGNNFTGLVHGIQWWGGDSGAAGASLAQVTRAGEMIFAGNTCKTVAGSCLWGSMAYDITMRGNTADGCGDVCFDTEGGLRTQIVGNTATNCQNGCGAIFFFTDQTVISGNHFRADAPGGGLILIKNVSQNPMTHRHLTIEGNELTCLTHTCRAMYQEAASEITFRNNQIADGTWLPLGYARAVLIEGNHLSFTRPISGPGAAIGAPAVIGGTALEIVSNVIDSAVQQPPDVACIAAAWGDFNAVDPGLIAGNRCGPGQFAVGLRVTSEGKNAGLMGVWVVGGNRFGAGSVVHTAPGSRERFVDLGECGAGACRLDATGVAQAHALAGCTGAAPQGSAVCLGPVRGWASIPVAP